MGKPELRIGSEPGEIGHDGLHLSYRKKGSRWSTVKKNIETDLRRLLGEDFSGDIHVQYACPEKRRSTRGLLLFPQATGIPDVTNLVVSFVRKTDAITPFI